MQENIGTRTMLHGPNHYCSRGLCSTLYFLVLQSWHMNFLPSATDSSVVLVVLAVRAALLHAGLLKQSQPITTPQQNILFLLPHLNIQNSDRN